MITHLGRFFTIERVFVKYGIESLFLDATPAAPLKHLFLLSPTRWLHSDTRQQPRGQRIRLALQELGPVFVKLGQVLSTRRDLLPDDIGDELALLQDKVQPFPGAEAQAVIEAALGDSVESLFADFEREPMASASVAQVHGARLHSGEAVVVKVLRPGIEKIIRRDLELMYVLADMAAALLEDGRRLRPREVVTEYDRTINDELDLAREASNAIVLRGNFEHSDKLYVPRIHQEFTRQNVIVMERIDGIPIRDVAEMRRIGMDMHKLAEHGVEVFYTQVFKHNFFHADMHPGNIFVSRDNPQHPQYIAVDFGIVGSLTDEDQRYIGENLLAFFQRDYRRVAQLHVDSGWVPADTRVGDLEAAIRSVCEPIFNKPLAEISFGTVLLQLFRTARRFNMEVQPQLVLLQKTLLNIEGLGRQLYPELDLWATGKPFLQNWMLERRSPKRIARRVIDNAPEILAVLPDMPLLVHDYLQQRSRPAAAAPAEQQREARRMRDEKRRTRLGVGVALTLGAALLGAGYLAGGQSAIPTWVGVGGAIGLLLLVLALLR